MFPKIFLSDWIDQNSVINIGEKDCDFHDMRWPATGCCQGAIEIGHCNSKLINNVVWGGAVWPHANCP
jgi:hypothetical protein